MAALFCLVFLACAAVTLSFPFSISTLCSPRDEHELQKAFCEESSFGKLTLSILPVSILFETAYPFQYCHIHKWPRLSWEVSAFLVSRLQSYGSFKF